MIFAEIFYDYNDEEASQNGGAIASELLTTTIILGVLKLIVTTFVLFQVSPFGIKLRRPYVSRRLPKFWT